MKNFAGLYDDTDRYRLREPWGPHEIGDTVIAPRWVDGTVTEHRLGTIVETYGIEPSVDATWPRYLVMLDGLNVAAGYWGYSLAAPDWDFTANHERITHGLRVWDYDYNRGTVDFDATGYGSTGIGGEYFDGWYRIRRDGIPGTTTMNGDRLTTRHPTTGKPA